MAFHFSNVFVGLCLIFSTMGHDKCPNENWKKLQNICWRESHVKIHFWQGIAFCKDQGHQAQVMPVGELRKLKNDFDRNGDKDLKVELQNQNHPFFVDAIKSHDGEWRDIHNNQIISFHHFPHFHVQNGEPGDSLIWVPGKNELLIAGSNAQHRVLCHWKKDEKDMEQCPGYHQHNLCNQAGDCEHGICHCDKGFSGTMCQIMERHDVELVVIGTTMELTNAYLISQNAFLYNFQSNTTCYIASIPEDFEFAGIANYFNDQAHFCPLRSTHCYIYNPELNLWLQAAQISEQRIYGSAVLVPSRHSMPRSPYVPGINNAWPRNYIWWVTGGVKFDFIENIQQDSTEINKHGEWKNPQIGPNKTSILLPSSLYAHCTVQINSFETVIIGGLKSTSVNNDILVYNWKYHTWRIAGQVPVLDVTFQGCELIKNPSTGRNNVLVAGGLPKLRTTIPPTWLWDPSTGNIQNVSAFPTKSTYGTRMVRFSEYEVFVINSLDGLIHSFTINDGWKLVASLPRTEDNALMLVPRGLFKC